MYVNVLNNYSCYIHVGSKPKQKHRHNFKGNEQRTTLCRTQLRIRVRACNYATRWLISKTERKLRSGFFTKTNECQQIRKIFFSTMVREARSIIAKCSTGVKDSSSKRSNCKIQNFRSDGKQLTESQNKRINRISRSPIQADNGQKFGVGI